MKSIKYTIGVLAAALCGSMTSCGDFEPTGYETVPELPTVANLKNEVTGHTVNVTWTLPSKAGITDVLLIRNANTANPVSLGADATSYSYLGQPLGVEGLYTVKVQYSIGDRTYLSEGVTTSVTLPEENLPGVTNLTGTVDGRKVKLSWDLPQGAVTGVRIITNGNTAGALVINEPVSSYTMKAQPMETPLTYSVEALYDTYYPSAGTEFKTTIPYITPKAAFLLLADSWRDLPDDDELAAAEWFADQENTDFVTVAELPALNPDIYSVLWIMVDRVGQPIGWQNLPAELVSDETIQAIKNYSLDGGNLFLSNMATQLTVPLQIVPEDMAPTVYNNGQGGGGGDFWTIMPYLGWMFRPGAPDEGSQGYYDRTDHAIFAGIELADPNNWGFNGIPLIGPGVREDHNCLWDCNIYGKGSYPDVIANFEAVTGSLVLATWGHVQDHCVAALVDFNPTPVHGRCVAMGAAAYEWNQNSGPNVYQHNVEALTTNILNYLK